MKNELKLEIADSYFESALDQSKSFLADSLGDSASSRADARIPTIRFLDQDNSNDTHQLTTVVLPLQQGIEILRPLRGFSIDGFDSSISPAEITIGSITGPENYIIDWGANEGVGTGPIAGAGCGGCGACPNCNGGGPSGSMPNPNAATALINLDQVVFLDFDSGTDGNIDYTSTMRDAVQAQMETIYALFGVTFVQVAPNEGDFSTLVFNAGTQGGLAQDIDFRNLNKNDNAVLNVQGLGSNQAQTISASANIGAHELGHILGLRHHDAFGPIAGGIPDNLFFPGFNPPFPGPMNANETRDHILNTPALAGEFFDTFTQNWLGEREAIKLAFAAIGSVVFESAVPNDSFQTAQAIILDEIVVPNTIVQGVNADAGDFLIDAVAVVGSFNFVDPFDFFSFEGKTGRVYSFEAISNATNRYSDVDPVDPVVSIFDSEFNPVDYYGIDAVNDDDVEFSFDSHLFDLVLPEEGTYYVQVDTFSSNDTGNYELFINSFVANPFPLPLADDHSDLLQVSAASVLGFEPVSSNVIAREEGVIGFEDTPVERDVFAFTLDSAARVIVDVRAASPFFNAFAQLFDADGNLIAFNDDHDNPSIPNESDSQFIIPNLGAGEYLAVVSGSNGSTGSYRLSVRHNGLQGNNDDHGDTFGSATLFSLLPVPDTTFINAVAELGNDVDAFRFIAQTTGTIVVRSKALSGDLNTVLRGYDGEQNLLDSNNNFDGTLDSRLSFDVAAGESYFVRLSTVEDTSGAYRLSFRTIPQNSGNTSFAMGSGAFNAGPAGRIHLSLDGKPCESCSAAASGADPFGMIGRTDGTGQNMGLLFA